VFSFLKGAALAMKILIVSFLLLASSKLLASEAPVTETKPATVAVDAKAKEDCDGQDKKLKELDAKAVEVKAAEDKALQNLGLLAGTKPKAELPEAAASKMETCK
jgi:hypothetical protein